MGFAAGYLVGKLAPREELWDTLARIRRKEIKNRLRALRAYENRKFHGETEDQYIHRTSWRQRWTDIGWLLARCWWVFRNEQRGWKE